MNTVTVLINGIEYNLRGKEDEKYLSEVAAYVDNKIREISSSNKKLSTSSAAVLTAVNIADELFKCDLEIGNITKKKNSLEERHLTLKERLREIKTEIDEASKARANEVESLKSIIFNMESKLKELEEFKALSEELTEKVNTLTETNKNNEELISKLTSELSEMKDLNEDLKSNISQYETEINNRVPVSDFEKVNMELQNTQDTNIILSNENDELKESLQSYKDKATNYFNEISELKNTEVTLKEKLKFKEAELEEFKISHIEQALQEKNAMEKQILTLETSLNDALKKKESYRLRNKDINFQLQNYKYKVLDLEKKLIDTQFNLAIEKRDKNPLLR